MKPDAVPSALTPEVLALHAQVARDKYLCGLLVDWYVRENDGEDHAKPAEPILRDLIKITEERKAQVASLRAALGKYGVHGSGCQAKILKWTSIDNIPGPCTCGLTAALGDEAKEGE